MRRRDFIAFVCGAAAWPGLAFAQQKRTAKRIGFIANAPLPPVKRFRERLQTLGWVEGENLDHRVPDMAKAKTSRFSPPNL